MFKLNGKKYVFDINKISEFVNYSDKNTSKEIEILDNYEGAKVINKTVRELTTPANAQIDNIKYDLIKTFISVILGYTDVDVAEDELPFGVAICFNTLINEKFLVKV